MNEKNELDQIMQDIQSVIQSKSINDEKKVIKIREIYNELKKKELDELRKIFNIDAFKLIQKYISECRNGIEKILLDIIELIAEKGIQMYYGQYDPIFNDIHNYGLLSKIEQIIKDKVEEEKEKMKYSVEAEQLIRIYAQIMKGRQSCQQMINSYIQVIDKNFNNLLNIINKLKEEDNSKRINNKQENEVMEREIKQSAQLIKIMTLIKEKDPNRHYNETRIPDQIIKIVKERIYPLIHINCPNDINCQQYINIPQFLSLIELKSAVFQSLSDELIHNEEFIDILQNNHNIIPHLTHSLIQFASQSQFGKKTDSQEQQNQQQSESSSFISLITSSINLIYNLIYKKNVRKAVINTPNALHSLSTLSIYKIGTHFSQELELQTFALRSSSIWCLRRIQFWSDESTHSELINVGYARVLVIAIGTASGSGEEKDEEIWIGLIGISQFFSNLNKGKQDSFPPQPLLAHRSDEQLEEEGGNEEIDSQLINKGHQYCNIKDYANRAKGAILNYFIEQGNPKPDWYQ